MKNVLDGSQEVPNTTGTSARRAKACANKWTEQRERRYSRKRLSQYKPRKLNSSQEILKENNVYQKKQFSADVR